jgi:hypothetical protein
MRVKSWPTSGLNIGEKVIDGVAIKVYGGRPLFERIECRLKYLADYKTPK